MAIKSLTIVLPVALSFGLAACDSRDYEAELAELQTQLGDATSELETVRGENADPDDRDGGAAHAGRTGGGVGWRPQ